MNGTTIKTIREWICPVCGAYHDRDVNASKNLYNYGVAHLTSGRAGTARTYACGECSLHSMKQEVTTSISGGSSQTVDRFCIFDTAFTRKDLQQYVDENGCVQIYLDKEYLNKICSNFNI